MSSYQAIVYIVFPYPYSEYQWLDDDGRGHGWLVVPSQTRSYEYWSPFFFIIKIFPPKNVPGDLLPTTSIQEVNRAVDEMSKSKGFMHDRWANMFSKNRACGRGDHNLGYQLISTWTKWPPLWQTTISNAFSWMEMIPKFRFQFLWNLFPIMSNLQ